MAGEKLKITIKQNSGTQFDVEVDSNATVKEFKEVVAVPAGIPADEIRLIFKGMNNS